MRSRAFRSIAVLLGILLLANSPANAGPVTIVDVVQRIGSYQNPPSLRLRDYSQTSGKPVPGVTSSTVDENADTSDIPTTSSSLLTGIDL